MRRELTLELADLRDAWRFLDTDERVDGFRVLTHDAGEEFFCSLSSQDQADLLVGLAPGERRLWLRLLEPDDAADVIQDSPETERHDLLELLDATTRREVNGLLAYAEDDAGGLMSPRFARVRPDSTVDEAIIYLRRQANELQLETIYYAYVLDSKQMLLGVVSFRDLFRAKGQARVHEVMTTDLVTVPEDMDQEEVGHAFARSDLVALPVLGAGGRMMGIVTVDDIVDVVEEEATEDIQKIGGTEALDAPYLEVGFFEMIRKRAGWMSVLFVGEMLTITAMASYEDKLHNAVLLATFLPLIISSGGNSGSQASTLVIRAMSLGEVRMKDWYRVFTRELAAGFALGGMLGLMGLGSIYLREGVGSDTGIDMLRLGATVSMSVLAVVMWGTLSGSMLPLLLRRAGFDPASASAPLVATLVDVTGLIVYFSVASFWLKDMF